MWAEKILRGQRKEGGWCQPIICPANLPETLTLENSSWLKDVHAHWRGPWVRPHMHMSKRTGWGDLENCPHMRELSHSYGAKITLSPPVDSSTCMSLLINASPASQSLSLCWTFFFQSRQGPRSCFQLLYPTAPWDQDHSSNLLGNKAQGGEVMRLSPVILIPISSQNL